MSTRLNTEAQVRQAESTLRLVWVIVFGAVLFSVLTVTPLVERVTPDRWDWTAPILPVVVDAAVIIVVRIDAIVARLGGRPGGWSAALRWLTGAATLALNVGDSALKGDLVGVGVHMVAPVLLIVTAEATLTYRRTITAAVDRIERERAAEREREQRERKAAEERSRAEREAVRAAQEQQRERERADRERAREQAVSAAREEREHAARLAREEREHEARIERERQERADARADAERAEAARAAREQRERADRERKVREDRERADRERAERERAERRKVSAASVSTVRQAVSAPVSTSVSTVSTGAHGTAHANATGPKMTEQQAREAVLTAVREGTSQRQVAALTGWSTGWVAKRFKEADPTAGQAALVDA
ncbi:DUF2637 domain-containing protein [Streptomyces cinereoruber]|uniref:DUF2637 domain-containing protein n=1 Tax=Streptomyces cinereoruber TaxID=67260 RepID=UPI00362D490F